MGEHRRKADGRPVVSTEFNLMVSTQNEQAMPPILTWNFSVAIATRLA